VKRNKAKGDVGKNQGQAARKKLKSLYKRKPTSESGKGRDFAKNREKVGWPAQLHLEVGRRQKSRGSGKDVNKCVGEKEWLV